MDLAGVANVVQSAHGAKKSREGSLAKKSQKLVVSLVGTVVSLPRRISLICLNMLDVPLPEPVKTVDMKRCKSMPQMSLLDNSKMQLLDLPLELLWSIFHFAPKARIAAVCRHFNGLKTDYLDVMWSKFERVLGMQNTTRILTALSARTDLLPHDKLREVFRYQWYCARRFPGGAEYLDYTLTVCDGAYSIERYLMLKKWLSDQTLIRFCSKCGHVGSAFLQREDVKDLPVDKKANKIREWLPNEPAIQTITMIKASGCSLVEIPPEIRYFSQLTDLELEENEIMSLPAELFLLTHLKRLSLYMNRILEIPEELGQLTNLRMLFIFRNRIEKIPDSISLLTHLDTLTIGANRISKLPEGMRNLTELNMLMLDRCEFSELPEWLATLPRLKTLRINDNFFRTMPEVVFRMSLDDFNASNNAISDAKECAVRLKHIKTCDVRYNGESKK